MAAESTVVYPDYDSMSSVDLIAQMKKMMAALEKKEKKLVKEVAKAEEKKVKAAPAKGVMPVQLAKNSAWVKFVLEHMTVNGWEPFTHSERCGSGMADVEYPESELVPARDAEGDELVDENGQPIYEYVFAELGGVPTHGHAMTVSKLYKKTKPELYTEFEAGWEEPEKPSSSSSSSGARVTLTYAERKALKAESDAKKEAEKAERKATREADRAAKAAKKEADAVVKAAEKAAKAGKAVPKAAVVRAVVPAAKAVAKPAVAAKPAVLRMRPVAKPVLTMPDFPDDGVLRPWTWDGVTYDVLHGGFVYEARKGDQIGAWVGMIDVKKQIIDRTVPEPIIEEDEPTAPAEPADE